MIFFPCSQLTCETDFQDSLRQPQGRVGMFAGYEKPAESRSSVNLERLLLFCLSASKEHCTGSRPAGTDAQMPYRVARAVRGHLPAAREAPCVEVVNRDRRSIPACWHLWPQGGSGILKWSGARLEVLTSQDNRDLPEGAGSSSRVAVLPQNVKRVQSVRLLGRKPSSLSASARTHSATSCGPR